MTGHEKDEAALGYRKTALGAFLAASAALTVTAGLALMMKMTMNLKKDLATGPALIGVVLSVGLFLFANIATIRGFSAADKAYTLLDENGCYSLGKTCKRFAIVCLIVSVVCSIVFIPSFLIIEHYAAMGSDLTELERAAMNNLWVIMSLAVIVMQIFSCATVYIRYLWRLSRLSKEGDALGAFALAVTMVLAVQLVLAVIAQIFSLIGKPSGFLTDFSYIVLVIKYVLLFAYFLLRRRKLLHTAPAQERSATEED